MLWHEQTWQKIAETDKDLPVVIPLGSCEQHGLHLPLFVDSIQVEGIAKAVNDRMGEKILMLPTLWLGASHHHLDYAGTVSVPPSLYAEIIKHVTRCVLHAGFRRIFFLNGHGGNAAPGTHALTDLVATDDLADSAHLAFSSWWQVARESLVPDKVGTQTPNLTHACEYETSLVFALREDLVDLSKICPDHEEKERVWATRWKGRCEGFRRFHRWTSTGHMGQPELATPEKGKAILEVVTDAVVEFLEDFSQWPEMPVIGPCK